MKNDLTTRQVAEYLGVCHDTAKRLVRRIPGAYRFALHGEPRPNSPWRVSKDKLDDFINRSKYAVGSQKYEDLKAGWHK